MRRICPLHQPLHRAFLLLPLALGKHLAHRLAHRLLVASSNRLPVTVAVHEGIAAPRLFVIIEKERLMCHSANQVIAATIRYESRLPHVE